MNYILRYKGEGKPNAIKLRRELASNNIRIVDPSALPQMARVELHGDDVAKLRAVTGLEWDMFPESRIPFPPPAGRSKKKSGLSPPSPYHRCSAISLQFYSSVVETRCPASPAEKPPCGSTSAYCPAETPGMASLQR